MDTRKWVFLGTGGTIAGSSAAVADNVGYRAAQVGIEALLDTALPASASRTLRWMCEQVAQVDSKDMDFSVWSALAQRCQHHLNDPQVGGLVITHGTDTLEETAWFLHRVLDTRKPVVLTCAMRPASSAAPDGPQNLRDAVAVATAPGACGVLVVAAGEIHSARRVQKVHPYRTNAFGSGDSGPLGWVEEGAVRLVQNWSAEQTQIALLAMKNIVNGVPWPRVEVVMNYTGAQGSTVRALVRDGVQGLVVAATGPCAGGCTGAGTGSGCRGAGGQPLPSGASGPRFRRGCCTADAGAGRRPERCQGARGCAAGTAGRCNATSMKAARSRPCQRKLHWQS